MSSLLRLRTLLLAAAVLLLGLASAVFAYYAMFANFQLYDDEGYFLALIAHTLAGDVPYDRISTVYGPVYLAYRSFVHGVLDVPLTTDGLRWSTLVLWILASAACAALVWQAARAEATRAWVTLATFGCCLFHLFALSNEPGHPQDLALVIMLSGALGWCAWVDRRPSLAWAWLGASIALCGCIKINLGLYLLLPALLLLAPHPALRWACALLIASLGWLLTRHHGMSEWRLGLCSASSAAALTLCWMPWQAPSPRIKTFLSAGALSALAALGFALMLGSTPQGLWRAMVLLPARFTSELVMGVRVPMEALYAAVAALALLVLTRRSATLLLGARLAFVGIVLWGIVAHLEWLIPYALPFGWLALPEGRSRVAALLCAWLPLQALQVFPVSGTQESLATLLLIPLALLCVVEIAKALPARWRQALAAVPLVAVLLVLGDAGATWRDVYNARPDFLVPGAQHTRPTESVAARAVFLADNVRAHADQFLSVRGDNSVYSWSGVRPSSGVIVSHSWKLFDPAQQAELAQAYQPQDRVLLLDNSTRIDPALRAELPFFRMLASDYQPRARIDYDILCAPLNTAPLKWHSAAVLPSSQLNAARPRLSLALPNALREGSVGRIQVGNFDLGRGLADSDAPDPRFWPRLFRASAPETLLLDARSQRIPRWPDLQAIPDLVLELPQPIPAGNIAGLRVRFDGPLGRRWLVLPIVIDLQAR